MCDRARERFGWRTGETRVIVQGFGNVGSNAAALIAASGYRVVGIDEYDGGIYNEAGLDIEALLRHRAEHQTIKGFPGGEARPAGALLEAACEVLLPAATENQITSRNAARLQARVLLEGANGPTTVAADEFLAAKGVFVIPDILANAGGVTVSYFEWVQDRQGLFWSEEDVNRRLRTLMESSFDAVLAYADKHQVNNRIAAYMVAIDRVAAAVQMRGIYA